VVRAGLQFHDQPLPISGTSHAIWTINLLLAKWRVPVGAVRLPIAIARHNQNFSFREQRELFQELCPSYIESHNRMSALSAAPRSGPLSGIEREKLRIGGDLTPIVGEV
jgi:hypothetical protein